MNVSCPDCRSIFRVDPAKVPPTGVRARCSVCSGVISIPAPSGVATPSGAAPRPMTSGSEAPPPERPRPTQNQPWDSSIGGGSQAQRPAPGQRPTPPTPAGSGASARPPASSAPPTPPATPRRAEVPVAPRGESIERPAPTATATPPSPATGMPPFIQPAPPPAALPRPAGASNAGPSAPPFVPPSAPARPPAHSPSPTPPRSPATPPNVPQVGDSGARRPVNPFLSRDPDQRAKRLARALVSDIITYHPAKHAEGLRDGTLKQLFREEIKKSFEEYIAQVGQQLAESTTYFQEALNEVLGGGKKIF